jgi:uncharacterized protein (DUF488 family)
VQLFTIGFTQHSAERFFTKLRKAGIVRLIDVRLNNVSQLAGFAKRDDLRFFVRELCAADYLHELRLSPLEEQLKSYRAGEVSWADYSVAFRRLLKERRVEDVLDSKLFDRAALLCSEATATQCHRRLAAE